MFQLPVRPLSDDPFPSTCIRTPSTSPLQADGHHCLYYLRIPVAFTWNALPGRDGLKKRHGAGQYSGGDDGGYAGRLLRRHALPGLHLCRRSSVHRLGPIGMTMPCRRCNYTPLLGAECRPTRNGSTDISPPGRLYCPFCNSLRQLSQCLLDLCPLAHHLRAVHVRHRRRHSRAQPIPQVVVQTQTANGCICVKGENDITKKRL